MLRTSGPFSAHPQQFFNRINMIVKRYPHLANFLILVTENNEQTVENFWQINEHFYVRYGIKCRHLNTG